MTILEQKFTGKNLNLNKKQKSIFIIIAGFFLLTALVSFLGWKKTRQRDEAGPATAKISSVPTPFPVKSITKEILGYTETQRLNNGFYNYLAHYNEQCEIKKGETACPFDGEWTFPQTNAWTSLGYLSGYQLWGDQRYLDLAKRDLDQLILHCEAAPEDCLWVLIQTAGLYEETGEPRYLDFLKKEGEILLTTSNPQSMLLDIEIRQLAVLFDLTKDNRFLSEAKKRLALSEANLGQRDIVYQTGAFSFPQKLCWQSLAKIEMGKQTGEKSFFDQVKVLLNQAKISANFDQFPHPVEIQPCIETFFELAKASSEEKYYQEGKALLGKFIDVFWDSQKSKFIYGEGGTIFNPYPQRLNYAQKYVVLTDSAYSAYLLTYLQDNE